MAASENEIKMKPCEGFNYPMEFVGNVSDHLQVIRDMEVRPDDVFITSYPKSGTHWAYEMTHMLLKGKPEYCREHIWLDIDDFDQAKNAASPRIMITQSPIDRLPRQLLNGMGRIINMSRNPKDVSISHYNFAKDLSATAFNGQFDYYIRKFLCGEVPYDSWFRSIKSWHEFPKLYPNVPIIYLNYEEMAKDMYSAIVKIQEFLTVNASPELMKAIEQKCQFQNTQKDKQDNPDPRYSVLSRRGQQIFYRKGKVGDWKNWFTVSLNEEFDRVYEKEMKSVPLSFTFSL